PPIGARHGEKSPSSSRASWGSSELAYCIATSVSRARSRSSRLRATAYDTPSHSAISRCGMFSATATRSCRSASRVPLRPHVDTPAEPLGDLALRNVLGHGDEELSLVVAQRFAQSAGEPLE